MGEALGKADEARAALADFDARAARVGENLDLAGTSAAIVRFLPDEVRVYGPDSFSGSALRAVGGNCQFDVDDDTWMVGIGLIGASAILDDVERLLVDGDCGVAG